VSQLSGISPRDDYGRGICLLESKNQRIGSGLVSLQLKGTLLSELFAISKNWLVLGPVVFSWSAKS
jgi:hypothetical protein